MDASIRDRAKELSAPGPALRAPVGWLVIDEE